MRELSAGAENPGCVGVCCHRGDLLDLAVLIPCEDLGFLKIYGSVPLISVRIVYSY